MIPATTSPVFHAITTLAFVLHIAGGTVGLFSGTIAIFAAKGGWLHRRAGTVFFVSMLVMAATAGYLAVVRPGQLVNLFIAIFASYLVVTAWMTVQRPEGNAGWSASASVRDFC